MPSVIILLDLNYTFVENSDIKRSPFMRQIEGEKYRPALVSFLASWREDYTLTEDAILITARPIKYQKATLKSIEEKTGLRFKECYFNASFKAPHIFKRDTFRDVIRPKHPNATFIAIESNPRTITEYKKLGVLCLSVQ